MKFFMMLIWTLSFSVLANGSSFSQSAQTINRHDAQINQQRRQHFLANLDRQQQLLKQAKTRLAKAQQRQKQLKALFTANEKQLTAQNEQLTDRSGQLGKVFSIIRGEGLSLLDAMTNSKTHIELSPILKPLKWLRHDKKIPTSTHLKQLTEVLATYLPATGAISTFKHAVITPNGQSQSQTVTRLGEFGFLNAQGQYLHWQPSSHSLNILQPQPASGKAFINQQSQQVLIDPTGGELMALQGQMPTIKDRIAQGGVIGYVIITLALAGLLMALYRLTQLIIEQQKINRQLKQSAPLENNALGRILAKVPQRTMDIDSLEIYLDEAVGQELPRLERGQTLVKLIAGVAPLLGLLGTVTGMIGTFQAITLFGTGDPKMMAGGISQALMTTVLGLVAAIPLLFIHNLLSSRAQYIRQILQQQSLAILANRLPHESTHEAI